MSNSYFKQNPDVAAQYATEVQKANNAGHAFGMTPDQYAEFHYYAYGLDEGRDPPFTGLSYLDNNKDVASAYSKEVEKANNAGHAYGMSPSEFADDHYKTYGRYEGRASTSTDPVLTQQYDTLTQQNNAITQQNNDLQAQYDSLLKAYDGDAQKFNQQMEEMRSYYEQLMGKTTGGDGGIVGGGVVPGDGNVIGGGGVNAGGGQGTGGMVYGPDGTPYSSPAAALAAGVSNFSFTPPAGGHNPSQGGTTPTAPNQFMQGGYQTGNSNPGGFIGSANEQLFQYGRPSVGFPY